jgi:hypothetical protein
MPRQKKLKQAKAAPGLPEQLRPYVGKHPAELILEYYEMQARKLLKAEGLPAELSELMQWHEPPKPKEGLTRRRAAAELKQWLKNFEEHHLRFFPEDRGKILKPRQAALREVLFEAEKAREAIAAGDPQAAVMHSHRLAVAATKTDLALYGETRAELGRRPKKARGIKYAIEEELSGPGRKFRTPMELWQHFEGAHRDIKYSEKAGYQHGADHEAGKISIEHPDFFGEVYFEEDEGRLYQEPDPKRNEGRQAVSVSKKTGMKFKTFETYFYKVKNSII